MSYKVLLVLCTFVHLTSCGDLITKDTSIVYLAKDNHFFFYFNNVEDLDILCNKCNIIDKGKTKEEVSFTVSRIGQDTIYDYIKSNRSISVKFIDLKYKEQVIREIAKKAKTKIKPRKNKIQQNILRISTQKGRSYYQVAESDDAFFLNLLKEIISNKTKTKTEIWQYGAGFYMPW